MAQVSSGLISDENNMPAVQIIPPLLQLYPDIEVEHADETSCLINRSENGQLITHMRLAVLVTLVVAGQAVASGRGCLRAGQSTW